MSDKGSSDVNLHDTYCTCMHEQTQPHIHCPTNGNSLSMQNSPFGQEIIFQHIFNNVS